jgi:hypothetical protein
MSEFEITQLDDPEPWDRQRGEPSDDFLAFTTFRNMGPKRTKAQVARELGLTPGTVSQIALENRWDNRVVAWDYYQERIFQAELAELQRQMAHEHIGMTEDALKALRAPIDSMLAKLDDDPDAFTDAFSPKDLLKLMKAVQDSAKLLPSIMNAQRLATNQPTSISEHTENQNIHYADAERLGEVVDVLASTGVLDAIVGAGTPREVIDAEAVEVDDGGSDAEADSLPAGTSS